MHKLSLSILAAVLLLALGSESSAQTVDVTTPPAASQPASQNDAQVGPVVFSQSNPRWGHERLGRGATLSSSGCLVVALCMASNAAGIACEPGALVQALRQHRLLDGRGQLRWSFSSLLALELITRSRAAQLRDPIGHIAQQLQGGMLVLLQLNHSASGRRGEHWVFARSAANGDVFVYDSAGGRVGTLTQIYGRVSIRDIVVLARVR